MAELFGHLPTQVSRGRMIRCVERELEKRRKVYPDLVAKGSMDAWKASEEITVMEAVLATLRGLPG